MPHAVIVADGEHSLWIRGQLLFMDPKNGNQVVPSRADSRFWETQRLRTMYFPQYHQPCATTPRTPILGYPW